MARMEWSAEALVLSVRPHGESTARVEILTQEHGRTSALVRGGTGRRLMPVLQPGNQVAASCRRGRGADAPVTLVVEPVSARAARLLGDRLGLAGLSATCAMLARLLPEGQPCPGLHQATLTLLDTIEALPEHWPWAYLHWERGLLAHLGYGLDLDYCAVSGSGQDLCYVSPRTGRAVSRGAATGWEARLLPLPRALTEGPPGDAGDMRQGLDLCAHFLLRALREQAGNDRVLPEARLRLGLLLANWPPGP